MRFLKTALLLGAAFGTVQAQDSVFVDIAPCMALAADSERHACYDRLEAAVRAARQVPAPVAVAPAPAAPVPPPVTPAAPAVREAATATATATAPASVADFGNQTPAGAKVLANAEGEQELRDTITGLRQREPGRWLITLASGQVWYQTNSSRIRLREGMAVRIYPSPLGGSFRLAGAEANNTGFVQVRRVE